MNKNIYLILLFVPLLSFCVKSTLVQNNELTVAGNNNHPVSASTLSNQPNIEIIPISEEELISIGVDPETLSSEEIESIDLILTE
jgi:hypothetical protein